MRATYEKDPSSLGPNPRANYEMGARMSLLDSAWAQSEQTRIIGRFQQVFADYDLVLSPTTPVSPFPWTLSHAAEIDGRAQDNYYRWLALTYLTTLTTHPALSLPCGLDEKGMPFGLQLVGRFRGDLALLGAAQAMESAFAGRPLLRRPRPDPARLVACEPPLKSIVTAAPDDAFAHQPNDGAEVSVV
jgi:Asp-tRNA(Asn)/Glu-tRNA(Gln) amidotransferase A subunit family amidase